MKRTLRSILLSTVAAGFALGSIATSANANGVREVHGGGDPSASFYSKEVVPSVIAGLEKNRVSRYQWGGKSQGTVENLERVTKDPIDVGIVQEDIARALQGDPKYSYKILKTGLAPECLYLGTKNPNYTNWGHVLDNAFDIRVATTGEKSGGFGTWNALKTIYPDLDLIEVQHYGDANAAVKAVAEGKADFFFFVQKPTPGSGPFKLIGENGLTYVPVVDLDMEALGYQFKVLPVTESGWGWTGPKTAKTVDSACTTVALVGGDSSKLPADDARNKRLIDAMQERVTAAPAEDFQPAESRSLLRTLVSLSADQAKKLSEQVKKTIEEQTR